MIVDESFEDASERIRREIRADEIEEGVIKHGAGRWYCMMCEKLFKKSGDCPACGFKLEKWPA